MSTDQTVDTAVDLALEAEVPGVAPPTEQLRGHQWLWILRRAASLTRTRIGLAIVGLMVAIALFGPLVAPHSPTEFVAQPNTGPSSAAPMPGYWKTYSTSTTPPAIHASCSAVT